MTDDTGKDSGPPETPEDKETKDSPIEPEVLDQLPPDLRKKVVESFSLQAFAGPVFHPVLKKINEGHIDKVLEQSDKDSQREF